MRETGWRGEFVFALVVVAARLGGGAAVVSPGGAPILRRKRSSLGLMGLSPAKVTFSVSFAAGLVSDFPFFRRLLGSTCYLYTRLRGIVQTTWTGMLNIQEPLIHSTGGERLAGSEKSGLPVPFLRTEGTRLTTTDLSWIAILDVQTNDEIRVGASCICSTYIACKSHWLYKLTSHPCHYK